MKFFVSSMLAGAYIGVGCIVLFFMGGPLFAVDSPFVNLITGLTFGVALAIVIWAGSDLFTGNVMTFAFGALTKTITWKQTTILLIWCSGVFIFCLFKRDFPGNKYRQLHSLYGCRENERWFYPASFPGDYV